MRSTTAPIELAAGERETLEGFARSQKGRADVARRARAILMIASGASYVEVEAALGWSSATTAKWKQRFAERRLAGLWGQHQGSQPRVLTPALEARILSRTRTCRRTRRSRSKRSWPCIPRCACISRRRTPRGSTRSSCGSQRSDATSLPGASSRR